jgi:ubiquinone biosynthesis protein
MPDGRELALKLKRPRVDRRMRADLALLQAAARAGGRLPKLRDMPMADLIGYMSTAILGQLDFDRERHQLELVRLSLLAVPDVHVPRVLPELSAPDCLAFEFVDGLSTGVADSLPAPVRARLGELVLTAVHKLVFVDGIVHCDLHPGNLYVTADRRVVILDAGYCVQLGARERRLMGEFFACLTTGDGRRCGEILLESAVSLDAGLDRERFVSDTAAIVGEHAGPGREFDISRFGDAIYALQQRYRMYAASDFAFPMMSLVVADGTVRRLAPSVDFQGVGRAASAAV